MKYLFSLIIILLILDLNAQSDITKSLNKISFEEFVTTKDSIATKQFNLPKAEQPIGTNQRELNKIQLDNFQKKAILNIPKTDSTPKKINYLLPKSDSIITKKEVPILKINPESNQKKDSLIIIEKLSLEKTKTDSTTKIQQNLDLNNKETLTKKTLEPIILEKKDTIKIAKIKDTKTDTLYNKSPKDLNIISSKDTINKEKTLILSAIKDTIKTVLTEKKQVDFPTKEDTISTKTPIVTDFSSNPIIKSAKIKEIKTEKNNSLDSLKDKPLKDFYIETKPLINKNGKIVTTASPPQAEIQKPTEQKTIYTEAELAEQKKKEKYNQYLREADSIRYANKKMLDSLLATLNVKVPIEVKQKDYIEIYVSGGGLSGGVNSKTYDRTIFYPGGLIQREYQSKLGGIVKYEKKITKEDLTTLAQFIVDLGFFELAEDYECPKDDVSCKYRMKQAPLPIPLTITVAVGIRRNTVSIDFYAPKIEKNWVNYPKNIEKILEAIYSLAEK